MDIKLYAVVVANGLFLGGGVTFLALKSSAAREPACTTKVDTFRVSKLRLDLGAHYRRLELARSNGWNADTTEMLIRQGEAMLDLELHPCRRHHPI